MEEFQSLNEGDVVLCAASAYEKKYYFNPTFEKLPSNVQQELQIACVIFTEECGGILSLVFNSDKELEIRTEHDEGDYLYDDISAGMLVRQMRNEKEELFEALEKFYKYIVLKDYEDGSDQ
ncbi:MAG: hypothetical protein KHZ87_00660 [Clostridiales bacterium]|nr:hypothetical protein [Clostridiales bacterium]MBS5877657.1 hypothetical protein [Clostridiales bacterium]MDU0939456.1 DUF6145 family protein [Clostridiales bacterium]MDU1041988.1 DUF6145 family protein [Clostridiales bacterium]MDU3490701.1 DUF6145 family protein [Clostridiales bacterium]